MRGNRFTFESEILIEAADHGILTLAVAIPGRYPLNARPSHFRPVVDIAKIVLMVATRLLKKGLYPRRFVAQPAARSGSFANRYGQIEWLVRAFGWSLQGGDQLPAQSGQPGVGRDCRPASG